MDGPEYFCILLGILTIGRSNLWIGVIEFCREEILESSFGGYLTIAASGSLGSSFQVPGPFSVRPISVITYM